MPLSASVLEYFLGAAAQSKTSSQMVLLATLDRSV